MNWISPISGILEEGNCFWRRLERVSCAKARFQKGGG
jgi:hypothetical protein